MGPDCHILPLFQTTDHSVSNGMPQETPVALHHKLQECSLVCLVVERGCQVLPAVQDSQVVVDLFHHRLEGHALSEPRPTFVCEHDGIQLFEEVTSIPAGNHETTLLAVLLHFTTILPVDPCSFSGVHDALCMLAFLDKVVHDALEAVCLHLVPHSTPQPAVPAHASQHPSRTVQNNLVSVGWPCKLWLHHPFTHPGHAEKTANITQP